LNLLAICDGLTDAEADKVVATAKLAPKTFRERPRSSLRADEGVCFTGRLAFTIDVLNDTGVQGWNSVSAHTKCGSCRIAISPITTGAVVAAVVVTAIVIVVTAVVVIATGLGVVAAVAPGLIVLVTSRISDRKVGVRSLGRLT